MVDVVRYERTRTVVVHRHECHVWTTVPRLRQVSPVVIAAEGWSVCRCSLCKPSFGVVVVERLRVWSRESEMLHRFMLQEPRRRVRRELDVPRGTVERKGWKASAGCQSGNERLDEWFRWLFLSETGKRWQTDVAKAICNECPVRGDCLVSAVWSEEPFGVWGGATVAERKSLLKRWRREGRQDTRFASSQTPRVSVG